MRYEYHQITTARAFPAIEREMNELGRSGWRAMTEPKYQAPTTTTLGDLGIWNVWMERKVDDAAQG